MIVFLRRGCNALILLIVVVGLVAGTASAKTFGLSDGVIIGGCLSVRFSNFKPGAPDLIFDVAELYVENNCSYTISELELKFLLLNLQGNTSSYNVIVASRVLSRYPPISAGGFFARKIHFRNNGKTYDRWRLSVSGFKKRR